MGYQVLFRAPKFSNSGARVATMFRQLIFLPVPWIILVFYSTCSNSCDKTNLAERSLAGREFLMNSIIRARCLNMLSCTDMDRRPSAWKAEVLSLVLLRMLSRNAKVSSKYLQIQDLLMSICWLYVAIISNLIIEATGCVSEIRMPPVATKCNEGKKSQSPTYWPHPTHRGMCFHWSVATFRWTNSSSLFTIHGAPYTCMPIQT